MWAPWYGISFPKAFTRFWKKYATFSGRASRSEYWWWYLWTVIIGFVLGLISGLITAATGTTTTQSSGSQMGFYTASSSPVPGLLGLIVFLVFVIPSLALQIRRLHDANFRGWFVLLNIIPILGPLVLLVMTILPSNPEGRRFDQPNS
ncbi:hypothetical protein ASF23_10315 [Curtobacterium sp. Leaf261]|nr:hypothetical protein ASF23_10315 [Curtobacterium sp. Leaf261]